MHAQLIFLIIVGILYIAVYANDRRDDANC